MKKLIAILIFTVVISVLGNCALAMEAEPEQTWYEITGDETGKDILTVHLYSNPSTGFDWSFEISDPELLELLAMEYQSDEFDQDVCGAGGTWVASFGNFTGKTGRTMVTFNYARPWEENPIESRMLEITVDENGQINAVIVDATECEEVSEGN